MYADQADFEGYVEGWVTDDPDALERELMRAEADVNSYLRWGRTPWLQVDYDRLDMFTQNTLMRATCAQCEYRLMQGLPFFAEARTPVNGPDYNTTHAISRYGPKMRQELLDGSLISTSGPMGGRPPAELQRRFTW